MLMTLPLFSTADKNGRMTMLRPGHRVGRAALLMPWLFTAAALWSLTGSIPFGALLGMAPTPCKDGVTADFDIPQVKSKIYPSSFFLRVIESHYLPLLSNT
ncbi:hypothetical protein [Paenibacillus doosanensis]|uniref:hypothetical protein n=1 Tax=Paenibacillus doosanensis TaxID=1229154 RepID=UPI0021800A74|nr:hypothetical protein [Paenibacillus doosanensis]